MTFNEAVAAGLRKLDEKISDVIKNVEGRFDAVMRIFEIWKPLIDEIEKARDIDRTRLARIESILAGHEVSLINLGADPQPVEDEVVSDASINSPEAEATPAQGNLLLSGNKQQWNSLTADGWDHPPQHMAERSSGSSIRAARLAADAQRDPRH